MIVSFGCSHSVGPYTKDDRPVRRNSPNISLNMSSEKFDDWPSVLSERFTETKYRHYAVPGHGALMYYQLLKKIEELGLINQVQKLIIQWTHELRLTSTDNPTEYDKNWTKVITSSFKSDSEFMISTQYGRLYNFHAPGSLTQHFADGALVETKPKKSSVVDVSYFLENLSCLHSFTHQPKIIFDLVRNDIIRMCEEYDIKFYEFAWDESRSTNSNLTKERELERIHIVHDKDFDVVSKKILQKGYDYDSMLNRGGHVKEDSQHIVNKTIIEFMEKQGLFNV